jgi:tetratricopeptide repeat protein
MTTVFIVRPFGNNRSVLKKENGSEKITTLKFDFDKVETELIKPAMKALNLSGGTTGEVFAAGDIREDMFSQLLLADIVIADITIYNANVFYELGIRHALRDKKTILIKSPGFDETPFDIIGYKYISYDKDKPCESLDALKKALLETINIERKDSPVFNVLPRLESQDPEKYLALPEDFINEVKIAQANMSTGKLALLAYEAESFGWKLPALRLIGEALFKTMFKKEARETTRNVWEKIINEKPGDVQANDRLSTVYQRIAETEMKMNPDEGIALLTKSDLAVEVVIKDRNISNYQRAEAYALKARNAKTRWVNSWNEATVAERSRIALQSLSLETALKNYEKGFNEDLNHFYSGINALGLLTTMISLAEKNPGTWELAFESKDDSDQKLKELKTKYQKLAAAVQFSIASAKNKLEASGNTDIWVNITEADYIFLTATNPDRVANIYAQVLRDAGGFNMDAVVRQLKIYQALDVKTDNVKAALNVMPAISTALTKANTYLLFTGHMIDKPDRKDARFPSSKEAAVKQCIKEKITREKNKMQDDILLMGIAGGASGGDILFHEICAELNIPTQIYLALPPEKFKVESVAFAGLQWIERFDALYQKLPHSILCNTTELPKWLQKKKDYTIWERNNLWELNSALVSGGMHMTLIALWDGKGGDGAGGTADMVKEANAKGAKVIVLDINKI